MHIPGCPTAEMEILSFADALAAAEEPSPDYDVSRWLYEIGRASCRERV